jgi:hypothetical protein
MVVVVLSAAGGWVGGCGYFDGCCVVYFGKVRPKAFLG